MTAINQDIGTDPDAPRLVGADQPLALEVPALAFGDVSAASWAFASGPPEDPLAALHFTKTGGDITVEDAGGGATRFLLTITAAETITMGPGRHYHDLRIVAGVTDYSARGVFKLTASSAIFAA